ncbi:MAG: hypothetical protein D6785_00855, partial [Planctomycetota bacterium]
SFSSSLLAQNKKISQDYHLEYHFQPSYFRYSRLFLHIHQGKIRMEALWKGPRGIRHDVVVCHPKKGIYQGEYYRDAYGLLFWEPYPKGKGQFLASQEMADPFPGFFFLFSLAPKTMKSLFPSNFQNNKDKSSWENLELSTTRSNGKWRSFSLFNPKSKAKVEYFIEKYQKNLPIPEKGKVLIMDNQGKKVSLSFILKSSKIKEIPTYSYSPEESPYDTVVDLKLLSPKEYTLLLKKNPTSSRLWFSLGKAYLYIKYYKSALRAFYRALEFKPQGGMIYIEILGIYLRFQKYGMVWQTIFNATSAGVPHPDRLYFWASKYCANQNNKIKFLERGLSLNPTNISALTHFVKLASQKKVLPILLEAINQKPLDPKIQKLLQDLWDQGISWETLPPYIKYKYRKTFLRLQEKYPKSSFFSRILKEIPK